MLRALAGALQTALRSTFRPRLMSDPLAGMWTPVGLDAPALLSRRAFRAVILDKLERGSISSSLLAKPSNALSTWFVDTRKGVSA